MNGVTYQNNEVTIDQNQLADNLRAISDIHLNKFYIQVSSISSVPTLIIYYESANQFDYVSIKDLCKFNDFLDDSFSFKDLKLIVRINTKDEAVYIEPASRSSNKIKFSYVLL